MKIAITSGFVNPIHIGHIECMRMSKELADQLWYIVNSDYQAFLKRGTTSFQDEECRMAVVSAIKYVDRAVLSFDKDGTVCETLEKLIQEAKALGHEVIFTKGADRAAHNTPEVKVCEKYSVEFIDGLGDKIRSSSEYIKRVRE